MQRQTAVTADFSSKQLLLFVFAGRFCDVVNRLFIAMFTILIRNNSRDPSKHETLNHCWARVLRRWPNIEPTMA